MRSHELTELRAERRPVLLEPMVIGHRERMREFVGEFVGEGIVHDPPDLEGDADEAPLAGDPVESTSPTHLELGPLPLREHPTEPHGGLHQTIELGAVLLC